MNKNKLRGFIGGLKSNISSSKKIKDKVVIIESDDWGAIRTPSKEALKEFEKNGFDLDNSVYKYDALASQADLDDLFDLLGSFKNAEGEHPIITANSIMANPDFDKIKESDFKEYHFEKFTETFKKYPEHSNNLNIWNKGIQNKIFYPQFHGREHLNYTRWLKALRNNDNLVRKSFELKSTSSGIGDYSYMEAYDWTQENEVEQHKAIISEGLQIFKDTFSFCSTTFIAPCYCWDGKLEKHLADSGIKIIQGLNAQSNPTGIFHNYRKIPHHFGDKNSFNIFYNTRNVFFEPSLEPNKDWVDFAMSRIGAAFLLNKPAVISSHRINYVGYIDNKNKESGLIQLKLLLKKIIKKWPDVKFLSTNQLIKYFENE